MKKMFSCILACDYTLGIAREDKLPWSYTTLAAADRAFFKKTTLGNIVIMGRCTFETLRKKPLPDRINIIVSQTMTQPDSKDFYVAHDLDAALTLAQEWPQKQTWVIGGKMLYELAFRDARCESILVTFIPISYGCNLLLTPTMFDGWVMVNSEDLQLNGCVYSDAIKYLKRLQKGYLWNTNMGFWNCVEVECANASESQYLHLMREFLTEYDADQTPRCVSSSTIRLVPNRTGVAAYRKLGEKLEFDLRRFPLLTSKKTLFEKACWELLWFLRGEDNVKFLHEHNVHFWDANTSTDFIRKRKLDYDQGTTGPIYGCQWRNFNQQGVDQIKTVIENIKKVKENPTCEEARRLVVCAWNPQFLHLMVLPPCHMIYQFEVEEGRLNCMMTMRSADLPLGVPFNICSYALLTYIIAHLTGLRPGRLCVTMNICEVYVNQMEGLRQQLQQEVYPFPTLEFSEKFKNCTTLNDILGKPEEKTEDSQTDESTPLMALKAVVTPDDFLLQNYYHSPAIRYPMAV